jgi:hypothetical protein
MSTPKNGHVNGFITIGYLHSFLSYDKKTGHFYWKPRANMPRRCYPAFKAGKPAGGIRANGYWYVTVDGKSYLASRLAHFYVTGFWPAADIDHHNRDTADNKWKNLRSATRSQNMANAKRFCTNKTGFKGVDYVVAKKKYRATMTVNYKTVFLGYFDSAEKAAKARNAFAQKTHGNFARL